MSNISKRRKEGSKPKIKSMGDHKEFLKRITKTLYYGQLPTLPCLSLPVTEISCELWSVSQRGRSLRRLHADAAAGLVRGACVSPCALVLAILYLERLNACNPDYLATAAPADLFLVSLMVGNKFLQDDGEDDGVLCSEWAASGGMELEQLKKLEVEFLNAINWNVFVNDRSFETGLRWLEKRVALKQARSRGFFTYTDLATAVTEVGADGEPLTQLVRAVAAAWLLLVLAYLATVLALMAAALVASQVRSASSVSVHTPPTAELPADVNATAVFLTEVMPSPFTFRCCTNWMNYNENRIARSRLGSSAMDDRKPEPWWSRTSVLNRLYLSSLVNPVRRWLEKFNEYTDFVKRHMTSESVTKRRDECTDFIKRNELNYCVHQWLNLSKLNMLVSSVSDR